ncbi:MAG TPA: nitrate reductase subunit beta, partial [Chloroflexota bacterium]
VDAQRAAIADPFLPEVIASAKANGVHERWIEAAQTSPIYKLVKLWRLALPLHPEFRTLPTLFYVPPLLPVLASVGEEGYHVEGDELFGPVDNPRLPLRYMAALFGGGNIAVVRESLAKLLAVRVYFRASTVGDVDPAFAARSLAAGNCTAAEAEEIYRLTSLATARERHAVPPFQRELPVQEVADPATYRGEEGLGERSVPRREY